MLLWDVEWLKEKLKGMLATPGPSLENACALWIPNSLFGHLAVRLGRGPHCDSRSASRAPYLQTDVFRA
jgi:hypothetical protein